MKDARFFLEIRSFYYEIPLPLVIIKFTLNLHDLLQGCYKKRKNSKIEHVDQRIIDYLKKKILCDGEKFNNYLKRNPLPLLKRLKMS